MNCIHCGSELARAGQFCSGCGVATSKQAAPRDLIAKKLRYLNFAAMAGCALGAVVPVLHVPIVGSFSLMAIGYGWILVALSVMAGLGSYFGYYLSGVIPGLLCLYETVLVAYRLHLLQNVISDNHIAGLGGAILSGFAATTHVDWGIVLLALAGVSSITLSVAAFRYARDSRKLEDEELISLRKSALRR